MPIKSIDDLKSFLQKAESYLSKVQSINDPIHPWEWEDCQKYLETHQLGQTSSVIQGWSVPQIASEHRILIGIVREVLATFGDDAPNDCGKLQLCLRRCHELLAIHKRVDEAARQDDFSILGSDYADLRAFDLICKEAIGRFDPQEAERWYVNDLNRPLLTRNHVLDLESKANTLKNLIQARCNSTPVQ